MTTLVVLATKHALVMGADSLGTTTRRLVNPTRLVGKYFDPQDQFKLRLEPNGAPVLKQISQLFEESENVPYNQMLHVNKLFRMGGLPIGVMFTGITSVGDNTIRGLLHEFIDHDPAVRANGTTNYTVRSISNRLLRFLHSRYKAFYTETFLEQELELLVGGYDRNGRGPAIQRLDVRANTMRPPFPIGTSGITFGGQMDWIQRIVFGTDRRNQLKLITRVDELLGLYRQKISDQIQSTGYTGNIPSANAFGEDLWLFHNWNLDELDASWGDFSEQNAIDCVDFFLDIMIRAQDVSDQLPTVGGSVHIAVIRPDGFYPVTKEVWRHGDYEVAIPEVGR